MRQIRGPMPELAAPQSADALDPAEPPVGSPATLLSHVADALQAKQDRIQLTTYMIGQAKDPAERHATFWGWTKLLTH